MHGKSKALLYNNKSIKFSSKKEMEMNGMRLEKDKMVQDGG
jgi:hypothetical protein